MYPVQEAKETGRCTVDSASSCLFINKARSVTPYRSLIPLRLGDPPITFFQRPSEGHVLPETAVSPTVGSSALLFIPKNSTTVQNLRYKEGKCTVLST
jgi:hypothetical protein